MKKFAPIAVAVLLLIPVTAMAADGPMKSGKYEIKMEVEMPGMPMKMPPQTFTHCVTPEEAAKGEPPQRKNREGKVESDCKFYDYKLEGKVATYKMKCEKQNISGDGKMTFNTDGYEMVTNVKMGDQAMTQKMTAKHLGECDPKK